MRRRHFLIGIGVMVVLGAAGAWVLVRRSSSRPLNPRPATIAVEWRGRWHGTMIVPGRVEWCPVTRVAMLEGVSADSGFAIALYERDSLAGVPHQAIRADMIATAARPVAVVALRWLRQEKDTALVGFTSQSGTVHLQVAHGKVSGDIDASLRAAVGADSLRLHGTFTDVPVVTTAVGCT